MKLSRKGLRMIADFEGFVDHAYKPVASEQWLTIGYGHYGPDVKPGQKITKRKALRLLRKDTRLFSDAVSQRVKVKLNQQERDALTSFCFNVGGSAFANSTLLKELNKGNRLAAANELRKWINGASGPLPGLVIRRRAERQLFLHGRYPNQT